MNYQELPTRSDKLSQSVIKGLERRGPEHCAFFDSCCLDVPENLKEVELILKTLVMKKIKDGVDVFILTNPDWFQLLAGQVLISMREYYNIHFFVITQSADALTKAPADLRGEYQKICDAAEYVFAIARKTGNRVHFVEPIVRWCGSIIRYVDQYQMSSLNECVNILGSLYDRELINLRQRKPNAL